MKSLPFAILVAVAAVAVSVAPARATTLTFDEIPFQPVDGLTFMGVSFDFKIGGLDSTDANYNSGGPGSITYVQDPSLEGDASGILTFDFASPVLLLQFGVAMSTLDALTPGLTVELFDSALASLGLFPVTLSPLISFTEGQFTYSGSGVARATLDFDEASAARFAVDNLTFEAVPEPGTILLLGLGLLGLAIVRRRGRA